MFLLIRRGTAMSVQHARHLNLRAALAELEQEGIVGYDEQAEHIGNVTAQRLEAMDQGAEIDTHFSEHMEWALHRRRGWMDEVHEDDPLEG